MLDHALKELFVSFGEGLTERLAGAPAREWLNVELPRTTVRVVDLVARLGDGTLFHLELQSSNEPRMAERMLQYFVLLLERFGEAPRQAVLYVGNEALRMAGELRYGSLAYRYELIDARDLDGAGMLESCHVGENLLAILSRRPEERERLRRVAERLLLLEGERRQRAVRLYLILSGLRGLGEQARQEAEQMGAMIDQLLEDSYFRSLYEKGWTEGEQKGRAEGRDEGRVEGRVEGRLEGEAVILRRLLRQRFGEMPEWAEEALRGATEEQLSRWSDRLFTAMSLDEVLERQRP